MGDEYRRFILAGTAIGGLIGMAFGSLGGGVDAGRMGAIVGMAAGATLGFWIIQAIDDPPDRTTDHGEEP